MFNERLKAERLKHHYTQEFIAQKIGVTRAAYSAYESGKRQPNFVILKNIAKVLNVTTDYLLVTNEHNEKPDLGILAEKLLEKTFFEVDANFFGAKATSNQKNYLQTALKVALELCKQKK